MTLLEYAEMEGNTYTRTLGRPVPAERVVADGSSSGTPDVDDDEHVAHERALAAVRRTDYLLVLFTERLSGYGEMRALASWLGEPWNATSRVRGVIAVRHMHRTPTGAARGHAGALDHHAGRSSGARSRGDEDDSRHQHAIVAADSWEENRALRRILHMDIALYEEAWRRRRAVDEAL